MQQQTATETFTIMNFGTKDVTNNATKKTSDTSAVNLVYGTGENDFVDLRTAVVNSSKGTWHNDFIDKSGYNLYTDKKKTNVDYEKLTRKGVSVNGGAGADEIYGSRYSDTIKAGTGTSDYIEGGTGNDRLYASTTKGSNTTFYFSAGDGKDTVYSGKGADTLKFDNSVNLADIKITKSGKRNLVISYEFDESGKAVDTITIKNYYDKSGKKITTSIKNLDFDGTIVNLETFKQYSGGKIITGSAKTIYGTTEDDFIIAKPSTDSQYINADKGNDIIYGSNSTWGFYLNEGNNTVYLAQDGISADVFAGEGNDTIHTSNSRVAVYVTGSGTHNKGPINGGNDTLYWNGASTSLYFFRTLYDDIIPTRETGSNDLVIRYGENNSVTIKDYFKAGNEEAADKIYIKGKTPSDGYSDTYSLANFIENKGGVKTIINGVQGTEGNDYIIATDNDETIKGNGGNDYINPKGGVDEIHLGAGNDILIAGNGDKTIYADEGNNRINLGTGTNTVTLGTGEDTVITSSTGTNTITFVEGDIGDDTFIFNGGTNVLEFKENTFEQLLLDNTGNELVIKRGFGENPKKVTLLNTETNNNNISVKVNNSSAIELFNLNTLTGHSDATESQTLITGDGGDSIYTGLGNDNIVAGKGSNRIQLELADEGNNNTYTYTAGADDSIYINGLANLNSLMFMQTTEDLIVALKDGDFANNTLTIKGYYADDSTKNIKFSTRNGDVWVGDTKLENLMTDDNTVKTLSCTKDNHTINASSESKGVNIEGCAKSDTITGSSHADTINGHGGSDTINGGSGDDMYIFDSDDWGSGQAVITDSAGDSDTLRINTISDKINLFFDVTQNNVVTNGNVGYTIGNDLYINNNSDYTFANAKTSNGVKITNYFTSNGKIENIDIPNGNDWISAFDERTINIIAQNVANWLKSNGYTSTTDAIAEGKQADLIKCYKPIISSNERVNGTSGNDFIIAKPSKDSQFIDANKGNDIIYGSNSTWGFYLSEGNNTVYLAQDGTSADVYAGEGNDTIHTSNSRVAVYVTGSGTHNKGPINGGNDTLYWNGASTSLYFFRTQYDDIIPTRETGSNDLVIRYGENNSVTIKDYFKAGNEEAANKIYIEGKTPSDGYSDTYSLANFIENKGGIYNYITGDNTINGTSDKDYILANSSNSITVNGAEGNDIYKVSFDGDRTITDTAGDDTLLLGAKKADISLLFNVKKDGTFADSFDKLAFSSKEKKVIINDFDSIETIKTSDGYKIADLSQLKSDVATWLANAKEGVGYDDVQSALTSGDDISTLVAIFNRDSNWQSA